MKTVSLLPNYLNFWSIRLRHVIMVYIWFGLVHRNSCHVDLNIKQERLQSRPMYEDWSFTLLAFIKVVEYYRVAAFTSLWSVHVSSAPVQMMASCICCSLAVKCSWLPQ